MSNFAERLRQAMFDKRFKAIDVARATNITPSVISRYLSGTNQPSRDNLFAVAKYLGVSSEWLLSSSDAPESIQKSQVISSVTDPLLKQIEDKNKIIELLERMVADKDKQIAWLSESCDALADEIRRWEEWKASSEARHTKGREKTKNPTNRINRRWGL